MDRSRLPADIALAANRIKPHIRETPLEYSSWLSEETNANVWLKLENLQITGSFKLRGAFNKL
jgi:threonine dehydratase